MTTIKYWYIAAKRLQILKEADVSYTLNNTTYYGFSDEPSYQIIEKHDLRRTSIEDSIAMNELGVDRMTKFSNAEAYLKYYFSGRLHEDAQRRKEEILYPPRRKEKELGVRIQTSKRNDQLERKVLIYVEDGTYVFLTGQIRRIEKCLNYIKSIEELDYDILVLYYKYQKTWDYISQEVNMSVSACISRRNKAIKELSEWT